MEMILISKLFNKNLKIHFSYQNMLMELSIELNLLHIQIIMFSVQVKVIKNTEKIQMSELTIILNKEIIGSLKMQDGVHSQLDLKQIHYFIFLLLMKKNMLMVNKMSELILIKKKEIFGSLLQYQILFIHIHSYINHLLLQ